MECDAPRMAAPGSAEVGDRRRHRRLTIPLPLEWSPKGAGREEAAKGVAANISTGGLYFELDLPNGCHGLGQGQVPEPNDLLQIELTIPPGEGHFPYEGRVRSVVQVLRRDELPAASSGGRRRLGLAARFDEPLKFSF